jgi:hypothetical protein
VQNLVEAVEAEEVEEVEEASRQQTARMPSKVSRCFCIEGICYVCACIFMYLCVRVCLLRAPMACLT